MSSYHQLFGNVLHWLFIWFSLWSNPTVLSSDACWKETSQGCEGRPGTPAPGFAPPWLTQRTDRRMPRREARARRTTPRRRGSPWRRARGASVRTRRTTAARRRPGRWPRRPSWPLWWFSARYRHLLRWNVLICCVKIETERTKKSAVVLSVTHPPRGSLSEAGSVHLPAGAEQQKLATTKAGPH